MGIAALKKIHRKTETMDVMSVAQPALEIQIRECMQEMRHNQMLFDLETEPELIEQRVFEYRALQCKYGYLQKKARAAGLRAFA